MRFYDRKIEIETLERIREVSKEYAQMTVMTGRRRIGKTTLIKNAFKDTDFVYFFVSRKSENLLCDDLVELIKDVLGEEIGRFTSMKQLFGVLMKIAERKHFTLVFDEFQNFKYVNESFFSEMQDVWDSHKDSAKINLILCGSIYSMMHKIFDDDKEPLYGRATSKIHLRPFNIKTIKEILNDFNPDFTPDDLLSMYMITGGVAKYIEQLVANRAFTKQRIIEYVLSYGSYFIDEGKDLLLDEFGKDYGNYFSILAAVASGHNERGEIKSYTGIEAGGYLDKLENSYNLIYKFRPYLASERSKNVKYGIKDNFLNFWFRFIFKYWSAIEIDNLDFVREKVFSDYDTFSGFMLERYFRQLYRETGLYNTVTNFWDRKGQNEIDLIAVNDMEKEIVFGEVKRNASRIDLHNLEEKAEIILALRRNYDASFVALSLKDM